MRKRTAQQKFLEQVHRIETAFEKIGFKHEHEARSGVKKLDHLGLGPAVITRADLEMTDRKEPGGQREFC